MVKYFISKRTLASDPYRIVYREVEIRSRKGYPISYTLKSLPGEYPTWEAALAILEKLNADQNFGKMDAILSPSWPW